MGLHKRFSRLELRRFVNIADTPNAIDHAVRGFERAPQLDMLKIRDLTFNALVDLIGVGIVRHDRSAGLLVRLDTSGKGRAERYIILRRFTALRLRSDRYGET